MANGLIQLPDLQPIADVGNNLINKAYSAGSWVFTHQTPKREAVKSFITEIESRTDLDPLEKAAYISNAKAIIKHYSNQKKILQLAIERLSPEAKPELIEDDWMASFLDHTRLISDEECQQLWARILCEECEKPGSISRQLLNIMSSMGQKEAKQFEMLCSFSIVTNDEKIPIIFDFLMSDYYPQYNLYLSDLLNLQSLGLISLEAGLNGNYEVDVGAKVLCGTKQHNMPNERNKVNAGSVLLTPPGIELIRIVYPEQIEEYFEKVVVPYWEYGEKAFEHRNEIRNSLGLESNEGSF